MKKCIQKKTKKAIQDPHRKIISCSDELSKGQFSHGMIFCRSVFKNCIFYQIEFKIGGEPKTRVISREERPKQSIGKQGDYFVVRSSLLIMTANMS